MAAAIFSVLVQEIGWGEIITVDSAGTSSHYIAEPPHPGTTEVLLRHGVLFQHKARQITKDDLSTFDYIVVMDERNIKDIHFMYGSGRAKVVKLLKFAPHIPVSDVPDPYFNGDFEGTYQIIRQGAAGLVAHLQRELQ